MTNSVRTLSEAELDRIVGGVKDNPQSDYYNALQAARNGADGTFGGSLGNQLMDGGSHGGGIPYDFPGSGPK